MSDSLGSRLVGSRPWSERLLGHLSRQTSSVRFVPEIDGLRFIAIWSVVLFHLQVFVTRKLGLPPQDGWLACLMSKGAVGVSLFFAISGLIISLPFAQAKLAGGSKPSLLAYYRRRLTRLEPPYILNLLVLSSLLLLLGKLPAREILPHLVASLSYTHNLVYGEASLINSVAWSLEVEWQFYVLAPLLAQIFRIRSAQYRRLLLVICIVLSSFASEYWIPHSPRWRLSIACQLGPFLCGFLLADLFARDLARGVTRAPESRSTSWDVAGALGWLGLLYLLFAPAALAPLLPVPLLLAYCAAFRGRWSGRLLGNRYVYTIGGMCYTIYLYHEFVISFFGAAFLRLPGLRMLSTARALTLAIVLLGPLVLATCAPLFVLTEKPFMYAGCPGQLRARWLALISRSDRSARARR